MVIKFGFRFFWGKPFRIVLSLILIVASLIISGVGLIIQMFDYSEINRQVYYSETFSKLSYVAPDKYMNYVLRGFWPFSIDENSSPFAEAAHGPA